MKLIRWALLWALASTFAAIVSVILSLLFGAGSPQDRTTSAAVVSGLIWGLTVGTGQWLVLRMRLSRSAAWIPLTVLGAFAGALIAAGWERSAIGAVLHGMIIGAAQSALLAFRFGARGAYWILAQCAARLAMMGTLIVFQPLLPGLLAALLAVAVSGLVQAAGLIAVFIGGPPER